MLRFWESIRKHKDGRQSLYRISVVILFWALADGIASFVFPVYLNQVLKDIRLVGLIFGSSSLFGIFFDFILGCDQNGRSFKPYFFFSIILACITYVLCFKVNSGLRFLLIMALWGIYFDSLNFGIVDFLSNFTKKQEHAESSGVIQMFYSLGYLIAPIVAGYMVLKNRSAMGAALFFMILAGFAFVYSFGNKKIEPEPPEKRLSFLKEVKIWLRAGKMGVWALLGLFLLNIWDAVIWSMGPIFLLSDFGEKSAYVMACFVIPSVFLQGFTGRLADKKGKKEFLFIGLASAGFFLSIFGLGRSLILKAFFALGSAIGASLVKPAADGLFIDMIDGYKKQEEEVAGLRSAAHNLGYIIGPILAGFLAKYMGMPNTFLIYGIVLVFGAGIIKIFWR